MRALFVCAAAAEAKAAALNTVAEFQGTYVSLPWGGAGFCDFNGTEATISNPRDHYRENCYVGAKISRIAFVNKISGDVLKEWAVESHP